MSVEQIIKGVLSQSPTDVKSGFEQAIQDKIVDIVNNKKIEVAQGYFDSADDREPLEDPDDDEDEDIDFDLDSLDDEEYEDGEDSDGEKA